MSPHRILVPAVLLLLPGASAGQVAAFHYDAARVPVHRRYEYVKSNRDGSHPARITLYVAAQDRIESLKWSPGDTAATLVVARLDWSRFSATRLESWRLVKGGEPELRATLDTDTTASAVTLSLEPGRPIRIADWPWHSYDFDFASLNLTFAHLRRPESAFGFQRADITYAEDGPPFADLGPVRVEYTGREQRGAAATRRYRIGGPGLQDQRGTLWVAADGGHIVEYEIPIPDEPGYTDVRLRLDSMSALAPNEWEDLKTARVSGRP